MSNSGQGLSPNRRGFMGMTAGALGALALGNEPAWAQGAARARRNMPNFYPAQIAPPDFPGSAAGNQPAYSSFPKQLVKTVTQRPANGGEVNGMVLWGISALPTPLERNAGWQQLNRELGTNLKINMVPQADYAAKWGTVTASGDLPDLLYISIVPVLPNVAAFLRASCVELSSYLGGDAVKDYPNLAGLPQRAWNVAMIDGGLWGVPIARQISGWPMFVQTSMLQKLGMAGSFPKSADDFKAFCKALTNPAENRWAFGVTNDTTVGPYSMLWFQGVFRAPNNWRLGPGGKLVKDIETEEYKAALAYVRELVQLGYMSPGVVTNAQLNNDLFGNKVVMRANSFNGYQNLYVDNATRLGQSYRIIPPFGHDGKPGTNMLQPGNFGWVVMKRASPDRVRELLRVLNYLAAPFGSEEFMNVKYGAKGPDWDFNAQGNPTFTDQGIADMPGSPNIPWGYMCASPPWLFSPVVPDFARFASAEEKLMIDVGVADPTQGFYSATDARRGAPLAQLIFDRVSDIAAGRKPISDLDQLVKDWKANGGDLVREEYEKAIAA
jgi:putative aldouronate transport system substrate-binding protein